MLSGRLRRRALALLGALLLVILIWPPCCATMPKPLPAVMPTVPEIDLPSDPVPAVSIASPIQHQQQPSANNKSRKVSELSRFMNVLLVGNYDDRGTDTGESERQQRSATHSDDGSRVSSANNASDDQNRTTLNLRRPENNTAGYSIEQSIDKNKSNVQQTAGSGATATAAVQPVKLDNDDDAPKRSPTAEPRMLDARYHSNPPQQQITHNPTIYSILFRGIAPSPASSSSAAAIPQVRSVAVDYVENQPAAVRSRNEVNDRGGDDQNAVNQSVFNPAAAFISADDDYEDDHLGSAWPVLSRVGRSASPPHHHRHQHYLTGNGTLMAPGRGRGAGRHHHQPPHQQQHQNQHRNGTAASGGSGGGGSDSSNLERNERSANLSHITGANRKIQLYIKNRYLQLLADGTVNGTHDDQSDFTILQRTTVAAGQIRIQGVATCLFLCMDTCGTVYGSKDFTDDCVFNEQMEQHHYNTYSSTQHSNSRRTLYLALNKTGQPRKIQIPVNRTLGKLATYTKALTQTVAHDRVERLISRLFGANHVRHGLKQLCETGRALQDLTAKVMRPRAACGPAKVPQTAGPTAAGSQSVTTAGGNKDKDSKDNMRKKKKKRRKCREDEPAGEHCFRPQGGSIGTNSGRKKPPGQAKSQKCSPEDGECVVSLSSSSGSSSSSSSGSPNSANSVSISRSSSSSNRPSASLANVPNVEVQPAGVGPKKKVIKKVNSKNTPSNVNSNSNKKPKKGPGGGGGGGGPNANKKAKQQQQQSPSGSSSSSSSSTVPSVLKGRARTTPARRSPALRSTSTTTSTTTTPGPPTTTPANLDDTSQSEDDLEAELEADDLVHQSAEFIEEDDLDEGNINLTGQSLNFVDEEDLDDMDF